MTNTYSQIYIHGIFVVKDNKMLISPEWKDDLYKHISDTLHMNGIKLLAIGGMGDHIHFLFQMHISTRLPDLIRQMKRESSDWVNICPSFKGHFAWAKGCSLFSYSKIQLSTVFQYINNQEIHHTSIHFENENELALKAFDIGYTTRLH